MSSTADTFDTSSLLDELLGTPPDKAFTYTIEHPDRVSAQIPSNVDTTLDGIAVLSNNIAGLPISDEMAYLRKLLLTPEQERIAALEAQIAELQAQLQQSEKFVAMLSPIVAQAIAQKVRDSREEMAEALYPVIGKSVARAVQEAMRDLARSIDQTMRRSLRPQFLQRFGMRMRGVDAREATLRAALPFQVRELLLIHRESGLLILHQSRAGTLPDADLISGMLTAIRSYVHDSFGANADGSLDAISYGDLRILIEEGSAALLAIVIHGIEPRGFQERMRQQISELHIGLGPVLRAYDGSPIEERLLLRYLEPLMEIRA